MHESSSWDKFFVSFFYHLRLGTFQILTSLKQSDLVNELAMRMVHSLLFITHRSLREENDHKPYHYAGVNHHVEKKIVKQVAGCSNIVLSL